MNRKFMKSFDKETGMIKISEIRTDSLGIGKNPPLSKSEYIFTIGEYNVYDILGEKANLQKENKQLRDTLNKVKNKIEGKMAFCSCEAEGRLNHEKCDKTVLFLKSLLDDLKEVE